MRNSINLIESLNEVKTLDHTEDDDIELEHAMLRAYKIRTELLVDIASIGDLQVKASHWPIQYVIERFFFCADEGPIGFAIVKRIDETINAGGPYKVSLIYIRPAYRRQGIATAFYRLLKSDVELVPDDRQSLAAQALWSTLG